MSNILIIKHGSLGDIAQASGVIQDISENHKDDDIFILTTKPYLDLFKKNPYIKELYSKKFKPKIVKPKKGKGSYSRKKNLKS